ncbi:MAG TPA: PAS domain S-box protein, partial [Sediminibacterium sp.]|nr:PAS domain S-box protein [Sediminibacterium sp.]
MEQVTENPNSSFIAHLQKQVGSFDKDNVSLQIIIDLLPIGLVIQGKNAEMLGHNQMALELLGLSKEQLMGRTSFDKEWKCIHLDGTPYPGDTHPVPLAIKTKEPILEKVMGVFRPSEEAFVWLDVNAVPVLNETGDLNFVICTFSNITKRIASQKLQVETEKNLHQIFEFYPVPILLVDHETSIIQMANQKLSELMGYSKNELIGRHTVNFYEKIEDRNDIVEEYKLEGRINNREVRFLKKSGEPIDVLLSSELISLNGRLMKLSGFIDISRIKKVESTLNKSLQLVSDQNTRLLNFSYIVSHNLRSHAGNIKSIVRFLGLSKTEEEKKLLLDNLHIVSDNFETTMVHLNE